MICPDAYVMRREWWEGLDSPLTDILLDEFFEGYKGHLNRMLQKCRMSTYNLYFGAEYLVNKALLVRDRLVNDISGKVMILRVPAGPPVIEIRVI